AEHFGIGVPEIQGPARDAYTSLARQAAMLLLRDLSGLSSTKVGERLYRDHSTVLWGQKTAEERRGGEPRFWQDLEEIKASLLRV
ncbi:MAG: helix-turn-helix domain-containing protein, partial [Candidatus Wildermuthbacteria bacterium]|nr:helix-turn-helix domain-containing protein [Candidatus Wildermuthbacteria bacterium]